MTFKYRPDGLLHLNAAPGEICSLPEPRSAYDVVAEFSSDLGSGPYHEALYRNLNTEYIFYLRMLQNLGQL